MGNQGATAEDQQFLFRHPRVNHPNEWLTPPDILEDLGPFDLDPASPIVRPWPTASIHFTREDNGVLKPWAGRVWLNPPYGPEVVPFMERMVGHGQGIALVFVRSDAAWFHRTIFAKAAALFFFQSKIFFYLPNGARSTSSGGAPSVLAAYGELNVEALSRLRRPGKLVRL